jgi:hypothetical protein
MGSYSIFAVFVNGMERLDQGHLHPSIKHPETDMSRLGLDPLYQRAISTAYAFRNLYNGYILFIVKLRYGGFCYGCITKQ